MPSHIKPEGFAASIVLAVQKDQKLQQCSRETLMQAVLNLAAMGLVPNGRDAHLIPFNSKDGMACQVIVDYKGLIDILLRNRSVKKIHADIICENDLFAHSMGEVKEHTWDVGKPRGEVRAVYAQAWLEGGEQKAEVLTVEEVEKVRAISKAKNSGPWVDWWNEMAKKTAVRRLSKMLRLSAEEKEIIERVDRTEFREINERPKAEIPGMENTHQEEGSFVDAEEVEQEPKPAPAKKAAKKKSAGERVVAFLGEITTVESGPEAKKKWTRFDIEFKRQDADSFDVCSTFSKTLIEQVEFFSEGDLVTLTIAPNSNEKFPATLEAIAGAPADEEQKGEHVK